MITTTISTIPNTEITEILSVIHNRVVLGTNLFSDISAGFSDIFGGKNTAYEKRLAEITNQVIEGLKEKAKKIKADALIDLKIDVDEISGGSKSMFMVTAIATAVKLNKQVTSNESISIEIINEKITKHRILKSIEAGTFNPHSNWVEPYILNYDFPEAFDAYMKWITSSSLKPETWQDLFSAYASNLNPVELFDRTLNYFSKENRTDNENTSLSTIFKHIEIDYTKILQILSGNYDIEKKRLCLNILYYYNKSYTNADFDLVAKVLAKVIEVFPNTSTEEIGTGLLSKGSVYWRCQCGAKNDAQYNTPCDKCNKDKYGNPIQTRYVGEVITKLEELLLAKK
jgi:uncharacterized protein YbjQ (UPF0145 family)